VPGAREFPERLNKRFKDEGGKVVRRNLFALMLIIPIVPVCALAASPDHFRVRSTADLVEICSTPANDSLYAAAMSFCHGYAVGAYHYPYNVT
jgi:hypothetical protein